MAGILGTSFVGLTVLAEHIRPTPTETGESVNSIIGRTVFGGTGVLYWILQAATAGILILAANTAYADFRDSRHSWARTDTYPGSSRTGATGWCSPTASCSSPRRRRCC
ncbi:MAG: hypothetical protein R2716_00100 [Microthrixaceae bacterium]